MSELMGSKIPELKGKCKERGLKNYSKLSKQQLIDLLTSLSSSPTKVIPAKAKRSLNDEHIPDPALPQRQDSATSSKKKKIARKVNDDTPAPPAPTNLPMKTAIQVISGVSTTPAVDLSVAENASQHTPIDATPNKSIADPMSKEIKIPERTTSSVITGASGNLSSRPVPTAPTPSSTSSDPRSLKQATRFSKPAPRLAAPSPTSAKFTALKPKRGALPSTQTIEKTKSAKQFTAISAAPRKHQKVVLRQITKPAPVPAATPIVITIELALQDCIDNKTRQDYLDKSFIPKHCIDPKITDGFVVSVRFCISRAYIDHDFPTVKKAVRVHKHVWKLSTDVGDVHVLEATGESLGKDLRSDWAEWIKMNKTLESTIRTKEMHDFPQGIARTFHGDREIARRAVLTGCAGECGPKLELAQMDSEWLGRPGDIVTRTNRVQLYLPESKQVMSVSTTGCHPALAMVHRSTGFTDIVLRETGQVVGNEYGLEDVWQRILHAEEEE